MATKATLPNRLHHNAYVSRDLEATRKFYEDVIGLPLLVALFGAARIIRRRRRTREPYRPLVAAPGTAA